LGAGQGELEYGAARLVRRCPQPSAMGVDDRPADRQPHPHADPDSSPRHIAETRRYLRDFAASLASTSTAPELYQKMLSLYPDRVNPGSLWAAAKAAKPS
jgi:hypothetical protein